MTLAPLLNASWVIQLHVAAAVTAFLLGIVQLSAPKGTLPHRGIGFVWIALMATVAISSLWIHTIRLWGPFSPIHLISIFVLVMLPIGLYRAHTHRVRDHRKAMLGLFFGGLVVAGIFTFVPGRIMHAVVFRP
jgi:uncharacterized membrane protein